MILIFLLQIGWSRLIRNFRIRGSPLTPEGGNSVSENQKKYFLNSWRHPHQSIPTKIIRSFMYSWQLFPSKKQSLRNLLYSFLCGKIIRVSSCLRGEIFYFISITSQSLISFPSILNRIIVLTLCHPCFPAAPGFICKQPNASSYITFKI